MATRNKDFPITIKAGSSAVKIYKETKPNGGYYRVCYYLGGKRERLTFSSLEEAKTEARLKAALLGRGDSAALELTGQERLVYGRAIDVVRPFNVPLDAAIEYAEARQMPGVVLSFLWLTWFGLVQAATAFLSLSPWPEFRGAPQSEALL
jgi:hypothetical protein